MRKQWRSLEALAASKEYQETVRPEFPPDIETVEMDGVSRRKFLGIMGASMAAAGLTSTACIRKPVENILPLSQRPEQLIPGRPQHYRTVIKAGQAVFGVQVESHEGRPTKIEGNPDHPMSNPPRSDNAGAGGVLEAGGGTAYGATNAWAQASILDLYDPARSKGVTHNGEVSSWSDFWSFTNTHFGELARSGGRGLALLVENIPSPTFRRTLSDFKSAYPQAQIIEYDAISSSRKREGSQAVRAGGRKMLYQLDKADRIILLDADILGSEGDTVRNTALFSEGRRVEENQDRSSRLYVVEPTLSVTGSCADNRLALPSSRIGGLLADIARRIMPGHFTGLSLPELNEHETRWAAAIATDLQTQGEGRPRPRGSSLIVVGESQPAWVHTLGHLVNFVLGNVNETLVFVDDPDAIQMGSIEELTEAMAGGSVDTLLMVGGNPVYTLPPGSGFTNALGEVANKIHLSHFSDETSQASDWHLGRSHALESWGDLKSTDGTVSIQQPLIAPMNDTKTALELMAHVVRAADSSRYQAEVDGTSEEGDLGYQLVRTNWSETVSRGLPGADFEDEWRGWLHSGVIDTFSPWPGGAPRFGRRALPNFASVQWPALLRQQIPGASNQVDVSNLEVVFCADYSVYDGRYSNNGWLQELPDPISKLAWDNAAMVSVATATHHSLSNGDVISLSSSEGETSIEIPVWIIPGTADGVVKVPLGYGRNNIGVVADGVGTDSYCFRPADSGMFLTGGVQLQKTGRTMELANTQDHNSMVPREGFNSRPMVRENTVDGYRENPDFVEEYEIVPEHHLRNLFTEPVSYSQGQQWGMAIDLSSCTGCSACVVACQAENNIPIVGKERVIDGREMHWLRIDRYFTGTPDNPEVVNQPMPCMQCEQAPCETVCPVGATTHSEDGLNDMAYNRCIGTRYCANNCPYKVRRFNFFNFNLENVDRNPTAQLQKNPDVSVRFRGVMEKCTYCVQRINAGRIDNHRMGIEDIPDGEVMPACGQVCASRAIVFGDINDPDSLVSQMKRKNRNYVLMRELNNRPRTSYLAKIRNPNPELVT